MENTELASILVFIKDVGPFLGTSVVGAVLTLLGVKELVQKWQAHEHNRELLALNHILELNRSLLLAVRDLGEIKADMELLKSKLKINGKVDSSGVIATSLEKIK